MSIIDTTENCRYCLMCRHMCPVGHVTHLESLTPHGWGQLVAAERRGLSEWNEETAGIMSACADCGLCQSHCVTDQPLPDAIAAVRTRLVERELAPAAVTHLAEQLAKWGTPFAESAPAKASGAGEAALFVGDEAAHLRPDTLEAALALLRAAGVEPALIGHGRNDGYLAASLGYEGIGRDLAEATLAELKASGAKRLFVLSPGTAYTMSTLYGSRLGVAFPEDVEIVDTAVFLAQKLEEGALSFTRAAVGVPMAYVDPTHTVRALDRVDAPRALLKAVLPDAPVELFWRRERAFPSGNGSLAFSRPDIADKLTRSRLDDARDRGAQAVVSECPGTLAHLSRHAGDYGLKVQGLFELPAGRPAQARSAQPDGAVSCLPRAMPRGAKRRIVSLRLQARHRAPERRERMFSHCPPAGERSGSTHDRTSHAGGSCRRVAGRARRVQTAQPRIGKQDVPLRPERETKRLEVPSCIFPCITGCGPNRWRLRSAGSPSTATKAWKSAANPKSTTPGKSASCSRTTASGAGAL